MRYLIALALLTSCSTSAEPPAAMPPAVQDVKPASAIEKAFTEVDQSPPPLVGLLIFVAMVLWNICVAETWTPVLA